MIMSSLKAVLEKQDQTNILLEKIFKVLENFKPLIDWVRLFLIYQSFEIK